MSTATATPAAGAATTPVVPATPATDKPRIAESIRRRAQGLPELKPEEAAAAAKAKADADKAAADAKAATDKKAADEAAAMAAGAPPPPVIPAESKVKKVKAGPALPEPSATPGKTVEEMVKDALQKETQPTPTAPALSPEVEREVELARFAAKKNPEKYADMDKLIVGYYQAAEALQAEKAKELGGQDSHEFKEYLNSDEWALWKRKHQPTYSRGDVAKFRDEMIADRARTELRAEMEPEFKKLARKTAELEHTPEINQLVNQSLKIIINDPAAEKDPALAGFAADPMKFGEAHPEEARLIAAEANEAVELIRELYRIDRDLVDFNPQRPTPRQQQIRDFAVQRNAELRQLHPTGFEAPDGKILIDTETYEKRGLHKDARYRIFTPDELAGMIAATTNATLKATLARRREGITKSVYAPKAVAAVTPTAPGTPTPEEPESPSAVVSRASGSKGKPAESVWKQAKNKYLNGK